MNIANLIVKNYSDILEKKKNKGNHANRLFEYMANSFLDQIIIFIRNLEGRNMRSRDACKIDYFLLSLRLLLLVAKI